MRPLIFVFLAFLSPNLFAHPLEGAVRNLSKASATLEAYSRQSNDTDLQQEIDRVRAHVGAVWTETVLAPVRASDMHMSRLGFELTHPVAPNRQFHMNPTQYSTETSHDLMELKPARWLELAGVIDQQMIEVDQIGSLIANADFSAGLDTKYRDQVSIHLARRDALKSMREFVGSAVGCIDFFSKAFAGSGLVPIRTEGGYTWSLTDLERMYHVENFSRLSSPQKRQVRAALAYFLEKTYEYDLACISIPEAAFFSGELEKLGKE